MAFRSLLLIFLLIGICKGWEEARPILESRDGNLIIASAKDRNITFVTFGKSNVNINDINLLDVSINAQRAARTVDVWRNGFLRDLSTHVDRLVDVVEGPNGLQRRLNTLENSNDFFSNSSSPRPTRPDEPQIYNVNQLTRSALRHLSSRVRRLENKVRIITSKLRGDECAGSPCKNGGTCIKVYDGYQCLCPSNWEGSSCTEDVDECANLAGTDLGCQNGATCINQPGSYRCNCATGWHGIHCNTKSAVCDAQDSRELCGHGTCIPKASTALGYTCLCDQGWEKDESDPACTKDVDECAGRHPACSVNPLVPCINVPGGYYCGGCPAGYTGNGYHCRDIDECAVENGGCSTVPRVQCINTMGSHMCGPCPSGFQGDGYSCTFVGACRINNGGCHPLATCVENSGFTNLYVQCNCPSGYHGNGVGPQGCQLGPDMTSVCANNPCVHGTCLPNGDHFVCRCNPGFTGTLCDSSVNPCLPNPCKNDGVCRSSDSRTVTCECTVNFSGPRCETQRQACGGLFRNPSGVMQYPPDPGMTYEHGLNCAFVIITNVSMVLNITFTKFDFEPSHVCRFDFLQIHDGANAGTHQMGRFCGTALPFGGSFTTTHNAVYLWLRSDSSVAHRGFALHWESVAPTCGGLLSSDHGTISSPGSPGKYPHNRDCTWEIYVRPGKRIQFHFFTVMMEEHPTCEYDYLEINETISDRNVQLGLYCNHTHPAPLLTSGSFASLHFHSDSAGSDMGFQITYSAVEGVPGCGGVFTSEHGTISSPGFPANYQPHMLCDWKIQLPIGERIRLTWMSFELETSNPCIFDSLTVLAGPNPESPVVGKYCGINIPASVVVESNVALIIFRSDWSNERQGFQLKYETVCGGQFHESSGVITSPYYPQSYPASRTCTYEIIQPPGKAIVLNIVDMEIESGFGETCYFDSLSIYDGDNENSTMLATLCVDSTELPSQPYYSTHNYMYLKFVTDSSIHNRGFKANYTTVDRSCGGLLKSSSGVIQSPMEGDTYSDNMDCTWTLKAPQGYVVQLTFATFHLEQGLRCTNDYVAIYEGSNNPDQEMGRYCGTTRPPILMTQGESMTVVFRSDGSLAHGGFTAHYIFIDASRVCGGHFFTPTGVLTSPNYPDRYPSNKECVWVITAPNKQQITLEVEKFDLEKLRSCSFDYLEIRNGGHETSPLIGKYCGTTIPKNLKSLTNEMYLKFVSDSSRQMGGFSIKWDSSTFGCGGTLTGFTGDIISPNYPQPYTGLANCMWKIAVAAGSLVRLIVVDLDLETHTRCRYDYIEVFSGVEDSRRPGTRYCGSTPPSYIETNSNLVTIRFRSDYTNSGRGFHIRYETLCNNKIHGFNGIVESPNFPNNYPPSANCTWTIQVPIGNKINITFSHFELEGSSVTKGCRYDYLSIKEGVDDTPNGELALLCNNTLPSRISSTENEVFLNFISDRYFGYNGFRLEWMRVGCGGHLLRPSGIITSPGYPDAYPVNIECEWLIEVDYGNSVKIGFTDVNTEKIRGCSYDKIELYGGGDTSAPKLTEFCHSDKLIEFTSPTNKLFIKFTSDFSFAGRGFKANYSSVELTCGGTFRAVEGVIHSANYPFNYPNNQNCDWLIEVDKNHVVNLTFTDFDIEDTSNCTDDYVKVFDGTSRDDIVLGTFCKNELPPPIVSTSNNMLVVMRSDSLVTAKGFYAQFSRGCGARIVTNTTGTLESGSFVHMDSGNNCTWIIVARDPADHVTINFFRMDVGAIMDYDSDCEYYHVRVHEGDGTDGPIRGTYCNNRLPPPITSTGNSLTVEMYSLYGHVHNSFGATYSVLNSACGGTYLSVSGTVASPAYPESYPTNAECIWLLNTSPGNRIGLTFSIFELETSPNCDRDYLEIREESAIGNLIGIFCSELPSPIESSKKLWLKFRSDDAGTAKGFVGEYNFLHGNELTGTSGEIASPLYPRPWQGSDDISWRITVEFGMAIRVEFDDVHIENVTPYCSSKVSIYDGYDNRAQELAEACGLVPIDPVVSSSNVVFIKFSGDFYREGNWFHLNWYQVPRTSDDHNNVMIVSDCVTEYDMTSVSNHTLRFDSPGYPEGYDDNLECMWVFTVPPGYHLNIQFLTISLEESWNCVADYIQLYNGNGIASTLTDSQLLRTLCQANETSVRTVGKSVMTVKFRSDSYINGTGFRAMMWRECGGELSGPNGVIDFNETLSMVDANQWYFKCEWNITVKPGRTIEIKFDTFDIDSDPSHTCTNNYIMLKNGAGPESPLLGAGKYCGRTSQLIPPSTLETTGNKLYVKAVGTKTHINFQMMYKEVSMACGGNLLLTESDVQTIFNSPNYPNIPPPYSECFWTFMAPAGERLSLHFIERFDLSASKDCEKEYVEVRDGGTAHSKLLGKFCRDVAPSSMTTTGNMLYVHFYTEMTDPKNGFKAAVTSGVCGGILRGKTGVIRSPNYPGVYPINQVCGWWIVGPPDHSLKIEFTDFNLPGLRRCENTDYVSIGEKLPYNDSVNSFGLWCGSRKPSVIETSTNEAVISFHTDNRTSLSYHGFSLNYTASKETCGGSLTGMEAEFKSSGYPNPTMNSRYCEWWITVPEGNQVRVDILDLDIRNVDGGRPHGFYLAFYNDKRSMSRITIIRKSPYPEQISSTTNTMMVAYWFSSGQRGLKAKFTAVAPAPCGGIVSDMQGTLSLPPAPYIMSSFFCQWKLTAPDVITDRSNRAGTTLTVTISGQLGNQGSRRSCEYRQKYVRVNDGTNDIVKICDNVTRDARVVRSPSPINFIDIMNGTINEALNVSVSYEWKACGGMLAGPAHALRPPSSLAYPKSCVWHANYGDTGSVISLSFTKMNMGSCDKGYIIVRNGGPLSPEVGKFCGNIKPHNITSSSNQLWIEYWASQAPGDFEIQLTPVSGGCGGVLRGSNKEITSPNFPKQYPNKAECTWEIVVEPGYTIGLTFVDRFHLETSNLCVNDFVQIFDWAYDMKGIGAWKETVKLCGRNTPVPLNSTSNRMKILFRSNNDVQADGFRAVWGEYCGGLYEATSRTQYIESPHYPDDYPRNQICNYTINAPKDKMMLVEFTEFDVEGRRGDCKFDNVTITYNSYYDIVDVWCGTELPPIIKVHDTINIVFQSDAYMQKHGFQLKFFLNECGGEITEPTQISPPMSRDNQYFGHLNCTWVIKAPQGKSVVLRFEEFHLEMSQRCMFDQLLVVEGDSLEDGSTLGKFCGKLPSPLPVVKTVGNMMTVRFTSDGSYEFGGMKAAVLFANSEASGCGGKINLTGTKPFKTQTGAFYESFEDCHWIVTSHVGNNIRLTITQMDLKNATNSTHGNANGPCTGDYLEVRDGMGPFSEIIGQYCGNEVPHPITSSMNMLWIRLFTDGTVEGQGVTATLESIASPCGEYVRNVGNKTEILESPGYPGDFAAGTQCRWIFKELSGFTQIYVHIANMDLEDTENCEGDHLEISDKPSRYIMQGFGEDLVYNGNLNRPYSNRRFHHGRRTNAPTYRYCGQTNKLDYYSTDDEILVTLRSSTDRLPKPRKFKLEIAQSTCNRNYTAEQGRIRHQHFDECWTTITAPKNHTISLYFEYFRFYDTNLCTDNYLKIHDGDFKDPVVQTLCGLEEPSPFFSTGNKLSLHSKRARSYSSELYDIIYTTTDKGPGCGGKLFNFNGIFTSPMYPTNYRNTSTCEWEISVPRGYVVHLDFQIFDLGGADICETDNLQIHEVSDSNARSETYCPGHIPAKFESNSDKVNVIYHSSVNNGGTGWVINFIAVDNRRGIESSDTEWFAQSGRYGFQI